MKTSLFFLLALPTLVLGQGSLTPPPGGPAPTMLTLDQLGTKLDAINPKTETRTPISSLPVTISAAGSYYLTGNLTGAASADGITITSDNVTLDLNGFALLGSTNSGKAIVVTSGRRNVCLRNGTIAGWGGDGVSAGAALNMILDTLRVSANGQSGILVGGTSKVRDCLIANNGKVGLTVGLNSLVQHCVADSNSGGFSGSVSTFQDCIASYNSGTGILAAGGIVTNCYGYFNGVEISIDFGRVSDSSTSTQGASGILVGGGSQVLNNRCIGNGPGGGVTGIRVTGAGNRLEGNVVYSCGKGVQITGSSNVTLRNTVTSSSAPYTISASNVTGTITTTEAAMNSAANANINISVP